MYTRWNDGEKPDLDNLHLLFVVHVVDRQTSLVDEEVQAGIKVHQQFLCQHSRHPNHQLPRRAGNLKFVLTEDEIVLYTVM